MKKLLDISFEDNKILNFTNKSDDYITLGLEVFEEYIGQKIGEENLKINYREDSYRKDIIIDSTVYYRVFGKTLDQEGIPYMNVLVRLFLYKSNASTIERKEIDKCFSDKFGKFSFLIKNKKREDEYIIEIDNYYREFKR